MKEQEFWKPASWKMASKYLDLRKDVDTLSVVDSYLLETLEALEVNHLRPRQMLWVVAGPVGRGGWGQNVAPRLPAPRGRGRWLWGGRPAPPRWGHWGVDQGGGSGVAGRGHTDPAGGRA